MIEKNISAIYYIKSITLFQNLNLDFYLFMYGFFTIIDESLNKNSIKIVIYNNYYYILYNNKNQLYFILFYKIYQFIIIISHFHKYPSI